MKAKIIIGIIQLITIFITPFLFDSSTNIDIVLITVFSILFILAIIAWGLDFNSIDSSPIIKNNIEKPHNVKISHNHTNCSGTEYMVTDNYKCKNCGGTFTLWYKQKRCPYCGTEYPVRSTSWFCS